jgi:hypothetical protein
MDVEARLRIEIHVVHFASEKIESREKLSRNVTGDSRRYADDHVRTEGIQRKESSIAEATIGK